MDKFQKNISIITDDDGKKIVVINDIRTIKYCRWKTFSCK